MAKITITEGQFKSLCRNMLKESRKEDYVKNLVKEMMYSNQYDTVDASEIDKFDGYDKAVAQCHIANVGCIIVYPGTMEPIDNEYDLEEIYKDIERSKR